MRQCEKFGFEALKEDIDGRLARVIDATQPISTSGPHSDKYKYFFMNCDLGMFAAVNEFDLPKTEKAVVAYLLKVVVENRKCRKRRVEGGYNHYNHSESAAIDRIAQVLKATHDAGRHRMGSLFAQATVEQGLLLP